MVKIKISFIPEVKYSIIPLLKIFYILNIQIIIYLQHNLF